MAETITSNANEPSERADLFSLSVPARIMGSASDSASHEQVFEALNFTTSTVNNYAREVGKFFECVRNPKRKERPAHPNLVAALDAISALEKSDQELLRGYTFAIISAGAQSSVDLLNKVGNQKARSDKSARATIEKLKTTAAAKHEQLSDELATLNTHGIRYADGTKIPQGLQRGPAEHAAQFQKREARFLALNKLSQFVAEDSKQINLALQALDRFEKGFKPFAPLLALFDSLGMFYKQLPTKLSVQALCGHQGLLRNWQIAQKDWLLERINYRYPEANQFKGKTRQELRERVRLLRSHPRNKTNSLSALERLREFEIRQHKRREAGEDSRGFATCLIEFLQSNSDLIRWRGTKGASFKALSSEQIQLIDSKQIGERSKALFSAFFDNNPEFKALWEKYKIYRTKFFKPVWTPNANGFDAPPAPSLPSSKNPNWITLSGPQSVPSGYSAITAQAHKRTSSGVVTAALLSRGDKEGSIIRKEFDIRFKGHKILGQLQPTEKPGHYKIDTAEGDQSVTLSGLRLRQSKKNKDWYLDARISKAPTKAAPVLTKDSYSEDTKNRKVLLKPKSGMIAAVHLAENGSIHLLFAGFENGNILAERSVVLPFSVQAGAFKRIQDHKNELRRALEQSELTSARGNFSTNLRGHIKTSRRELAREVIASITAKLAKAGVDFVALQEAPSVQFGIEQDSVEYEIKFLRTAIKDGLKMRGSRLGFKLMEHPSHGLYAVNPHGRAAILELAADGIRGESAATYIDIQTKQLLSAEEVVLGNLIQRTLCPSDFKKSALPKTLSEVEKKKILDDHYRS